MKKSLLLPALLLAACTVAPPQPPFKVGDVLVLTGTTKTAQPVNQKYTLSRAGEYADGKWNYRIINLADTLAFGQFQVDGEGGYAMLEATNLNSKADGGKSTKTFCIVFPEAKTWRSAEGVMVHDTLENVSALEKELDKLTDEASTRALLANSGKCTMSRE